MEMEEWKRQVESSKLSLAEAERRSTSLAQATKAAEAARNDADIVISGERARANAAEDSLLHFRAANAGIEASAAAAAEARAVATAELEEAKRALDAALKVRRATTQSVLQCVTSMPPTFGADVGHEAMSK